MADSKRDGKTKIVRQTVTVAFNLLGDGTGDEKGVVRQLNILAPSQEVILRQITVTGAEYANNTLITCDTFGDRGLIGSFSGAEYTTVSPNSTFMVTGQAKVVKFGFVKYGLDASGAVPPTPSQMVANVILTLEFRAYIPIGGYGRRRRDRCDYRH